jgi:hypothetical protein
MRDALVAVRSHVTGLVSPAPPRRPSSTRPPTPPPASGAGGARPVWVQRLVDDVRAHTGDATAIVDISPYTATGRAFDLARRPALLVLKIDSVAHVVQKIAFANAARLFVLVLSPPQLRHGGRVERWLPRATVDERIAVDRLPVARPSAYVRHLPDSLGQIVYDGGATARHHDFRSVDDEVVRALTAYLRPVFGMRTRDGALAQRDDAGLRDEAFLRLFEQSALSLFEVSVEGQRLARWRPLWRRDASEAMRRLAFDG